MDKIRENSERIIEALNKISEEYPEERYLKSIILTALASYNIGDLTNFHDITSVYMLWLKRKIENVEQKVDKRKLN